MKLLLFLSIGISALFGINEPYSYDPFKAYIPATQNPPPATTVPKIPQRVALPEVTGVLGGRVFVNGNWYEVGQSLGQYQLYHVGLNTITFKYEDKIIAVPIGRGGQIVQVKEKE